MEKSPSIDFKLNGQNRGLWPYIPEHSAIRKWANEISRLCHQQKNGSHWDLSGHGVIIEADEPEEVAMLIENIAGYIDIKLHSIVSADIAKHLPSFLEHLSLEEPALIYLHPGNWMGDTPGMHAGPDTEDCAPDQATRSLELITGYIQNKLGSRPIVFITAVQKFNQIHQNLRIAGLFDRRIKLPDLADDAVADSFINEIGANLLGQSITGSLHRLTALIHNEYPDRRRRSLVQVALRRLAWRESRKIEFNDLVLFAAHGTCEVDHPANARSDRRRHAIHEAGHAVISHLDSREKFAPAYCSILSRNGKLGMVVTDFEGHENRTDDPSYLDITHKIRVFLAGRAAEQMLLGAEDTSASGAMSDLEIATELAHKLLLRCGHSADISTLESACANLAVFPDELSACSSISVHEKVRKFLQVEYLKTIRILEHNSFYLQRIIDALQFSGVLFKEDFDNIWRDRRTHTKVRASINR